MQTKILCGFSHKANAKIHHILYKKTIGEIYKTGLPVVVCDESKQQGNNFASRLHHAIQSCFDDGYNSVITVGSDCPHLKAVDILHCQKELVKGNNVVGPDNRGGIYLLGIQQKQFSSIDLHNIQWNSTNVLSQIRASFSTIQTAIYLMATLVDLNSQKDFSHIFKHAANNIFLQILHDIIHSKRFHFLSFAHFFTPLSFIAIKKFRGPPAMLFI
ncbi:MAG: DUF2064 domain-containing protein [Chitinophagaceae bacterium]|nr:DUF2064 domain-containing protein [Chitinophagaceae bacterium]